MIVFDLCCDKGHAFEGWFGSFSVFQDQCARDMVSCPVCGSTTIVRKPSAPYVNTRSMGEHKDKPSSVVKPFTEPPPPEAVAAVLDMLRKAARQSEDVGERFPEEARRIHYGETEARSIKGKASHDDLDELIDEGIMVLPVPPDETDLH